MFGARTSTKKDESGSENRPPLNELRDAITRLETLVQKARKAWSKANGSASSSRKSPKKVANKGNSLYNNHKRSSNISTASNDSSNSPDRDNKKLQQPRSGGEQATRAKFISFDPADEEEFVELFRRTAEIVVRGERSAAVARNRKEASKQSNETEILGHLELFEHFCERNALALIVSVVTGSAFSFSSNLSDNSEHGNVDVDSENFECTMLPPLSIATQAVQSVAILIQNVSHATSLYFLLSNNRVNELIGLPLELYAEAQEHAHNQSDTSTDSPGNKNRGKFRDSAEMNELATHFVSFLKSLAMRINAETLQFFLSYPTETNAPTTTSAPQIIAEKASKVLGIGKKESVMEDDLKTVQSVTASMEIEVDFPLYARALEFCSADQDSFVRVTAMNICLNTLRLATVPTPSTENEQSVENSPSNTVESSQQNSEKNPSVSVLQKVPSTRLHAPPDISIDKVDLPQRERMAIAHHVSCPSRVQELVSPIFSRLAQLCGELEEAIRALDKRYAQKNVNDIGASDESPSRNKLETAIQNVVGNLQDELLLLDDVLKVGLISLNEQTIEMMLATFIYPLLLQPLLMYAQRPRRQISEEDVHFNGNVADDKESSQPSRSHHIEQLVSTHVTHPFTFESVSDSLRQSGLLHNFGGSEQQPDGTAESSKHSSFTENSGNHNVILPNSSPAKTALFALSTVFRTISNRHLLRLLLTSLLHPLAPDASGGITIKSRPNVVSVCNDEMYIRIDDSAYHGLPSNVSDYTFGRSINFESTVKLDHEDPKESDTNDSKVKSEYCVFVLTPSLAYILDGGVDKTETNSTESFKLKVRPNPYRRVLLACLAGTDKMSSLQKIAVFAVDAAIHSMKGMGLNEVLFGTKNLRRDPSSHTLNESEKEILSNANAMCQGVFGKTNISSLFRDMGDSSRDFLYGQNNSRTPKFDSAFSITHVVEVIASLCVSIMTASVCVNGIWRLDYDSVSAHALMGVVAGDAFSKEIATNLITLRHRQSALFLAQLPSLIDTAGIENLKGKNSIDGPKAIIEDEDEDQLDLLMDRIFRDSFDENDGSVINSLQFVRSQDKKVISFLTNVSKESSLENSLALICEPSISQETFLVSENKTASLQCAASSSIAHLQLDALATLIGKNSWSAEKKEGQDANESEVTDVVMRPISHSLQLALLSDNQDRRHDHDVLFPQPGTVISLVGRAAFPCVCEVSNACASLFTDESASVVADGIKWQSLYLVLLSRHLLLAEPEKGGLGGNGRIVTSCLLSCLYAEKDKLHFASNASPARRLLLSHVSLDPTPPGVFNLESKNKTPKKADPSDRNTFHSRMDLWFEDKPAADSAYDALYTRICKARSRRGRRLREVFLRESYSA